jgi:hypothetical protein
MKEIRSYLILATGIFFILPACKKEKLSNGESIFRTGKNLDGKVMMDVKASERKIQASCQDCHGRNGGSVLNRKESIKYKDLTDPSLRDYPYNDSLIERFIDQRIKSNGSAANTGVVWKMGKQDKIDLLEFLKTLR